MNNTIPSITIGLDLGDKKHAICVLDASGAIIDERTITNHRESLRRLSKKYPGARIALEVGSHSPWTSRFLSELGHGVLVANARSRAEGRRRDGRPKGPGRSPEQAGGACESTCAPSTPTIVRAIKPMPGCWLASGGSIPRC